MSLIQYINIVKVSKQMNPPAHMVKRKQPVQNYLFVMSQIHCTRLLSLQQFSPTHSQKTASKTAFHCTSQYTLFQLHTLDVNIYLNIFSTYFITQLLPLIFFLIFVFTYIVSWTFQGCIFAICYTFIKVHVTNKESQILNKA